MGEQGNKGNRRTGEKGDKENRGTRETGEQRNRATRGTREQGEQKKRATRGTRATGKKAKGATRGTGKQGNNSPSLTGQLSSLKQHTRACKRSDTRERKQSGSTYTVSCNIKQIRRTLKHGPLQVKINSKTLVFL